MAEIVQTIEKAARAATRYRGLMLPATAALLIVVLLVPLTPMLMDILLATNIALSAMILLTTIQIASPLEFSVFPSVLLGSTLARLVLNVATTRLILTAGAGGRDLAEAQTAAGHVVWGFSQFVTANADTLAVGAILFAIIVIVQFVVITSGASRISEVAARFVLDAMPGRQMAIDADLGAGLIDAEEARRRREQVARQADFYGAMDGASKFLRGDAIAGVFIIAVNILGGLYVGMAKYGWDFSQTADLFTRLTIGEGLVAQIPAVIVSVSAALLVTRSATRTNLGEEMIGQLFSRPVVLFLTGSFLAVLMLTSLPKLPLLLLAAGLGGLGWLLLRRRAAASTAQTETPGLDTRPVEALPPVETIRIELGFSLVRLADAQRDGDLLERIAILRRRIAGELGLLVPQVAIHDDMQIDAHAYTIKIRGGRVATGRLYPGQLLAMGGEDASARLIGRRVEDPVAGAEAVWISPAQRERAEAMNYAVREPAEVLIAHLAEIIRRHAADLLSRQQVSSMLEGLKAAAPSLVQDVTKTCSIGTVQKVLQNLLRERVSIHDLELILEAMGEHPAAGENAAMLTEHVRSALARTLSQQYCGADGKLWCVSVDPALEETLGSHLRAGPDTESMALPADLAGKARKALAAGLARLSAQGRSPVLLCAPSVRQAVRQLVAGTSPEAAVLAYNEIESVHVQSIANIGIEE